MQQRPIKELYVTFLVCLGAKAKLGRRKPIVLVSLLSEIYVGPSLKQVSFFKKNPIERSAAATAVAADSISHSLFCLIPLVRFY